MKIDNKPDNNGVTFLYSSTLKSECTPELCLNECFFFTLDPEKLGLITSEIRKSNSLQSLTEKHGCGLQLHRSVKS